MSHIRDVALGNSYEVPAVIDELSKTKAMVRLGNILQCPFSRKYTKTHKPMRNTRLEHSRGATYVVGEIAKTVGWEPEEYQIATFLHDINHPAPGGHVLEGIFDYESRLQDTIRNDEEIERILNKHGYDIKKIVQLSEHQIIQQWEFLDYCTRDGWYFDQNTNLNFGKEFSRLLLHMKDIERRAEIVEDECLPSIDVSLHQFLFLRARLAENVYHGNPERYTGSLVRNLVKRGMDEGKLTEGTLYSETPQEFYNKLLDETISVKNLLDVTRNYINLVFLGFGRLEEHSDFFEDPTEPNYRVGHEDAKRLGLLRYRENFELKEEMEEDIRREGVKFATIDWIKIMKPKVIKIKGTPSGEETVGEDLIPLYENLNDFRVYGLPGTRKICENIFGIPHQGSDISEEDATVLY